MRTFQLAQLPNVIRDGLMVGSLAVLAAAPVAAADTASSVNFVDRAALAATSPNGWRTNPLRAGSAANGLETGNSLRQQVQPASYEAPADSESGSNTRAPNGLQLRPHSEPTGIFSGMMGGGAKPQAKSLGQPAGTQGHALRTQQSNPVSTTAIPPKTAAENAMKYLPSFQTNAAKKHAEAAAARNAAATAARAGSAPQARPTVAQAPAQLAAQRPNVQASYSTAASAQAYRPQTTASAPPAAAPGAPAPNRRRAWYPPENPNPASAHATAYVRPPAAKTPKMAAAAQTPAAAAIDFDPSSPAQALGAAHQLASTARSEADFSKIFGMCQQIPASKATDEEAAFGRQLAAWSLNRRGQLRARSGNTEAAMADFDLAVRVDAKCWRALHNRGVLLAQAGQFEPAFDDFHQTIGLNPSFAKAYANRAALYVLAGELEPAQSDYERAIELDGNFAVAHRGCGRTCHLLGQTDEAYEHLTQAIELAPNDAAALASRGDLLTDLGEYAAAANDYERALATSAKSVDACRGSAWLLATCPDPSIRNPELALERAQTAMKLQRKADTATLDTLAAAQAAVGEFEAATQSIRRAIELAPPSERSVYQDRLQLYRSSRPYEIAPLGDVQQVGFEQ